MAYRKLIYTFFILMLPIAGCMNKTKPASAHTQPITIYRIWHFKKTDMAAGNKTTAWIGNNSLDMRNKDTLQFSYGGMHNKPTAYPYQIVRDTIFIQHKPGYKIVKLTDSALYLMAVFGHSKAVGKNSEVMIYKTY